MGDIRIGCNNFFSTARAYRCLDIPLSVHLVRFLTGAYFQPIVEEPRSDSPDTVESEQVSEVESTQVENAEMEVDNDSNILGATVPDSTDVTQSGNAGTAVEEIADN